MKIKYFGLILSLLLVFVTHGITAQPFTYSTKSKGAIKKFELAVSFYQTKNYEEALYYLDKALEKDENFEEVFVMKGDIYADLKNVDKSLENYQKAYDLNERKYVKLLYIMAKIELTNGKYADANKHIVSYYQSGRVDPRLANIVNQMIERSEFGMQQVANPVPFDPQNMGGKINSDMDDMVNTISTDDQTLIITVNLRADENTMNPQNKFEEDFFISTRDEDSSWALVQDLGPIFNTNGNEGAMTMSPDGRTMIYTACYRQDGQGRCDLYISEKKNNRWTRVKNMGTPINTGAWESHASLSVDGKTLYYVSTRKGSIGKTDIWKSERQEDGTWSDPINLGDVVNSKGREMTPFIHPDGKTLYFASDGHMGMGGLDFFMCRMDEKGNWSEPVNLGYPINTHMDEQGMIINATGELAYISSSRMGGVGKHDIYTFELYNDVRPVKVNYMQGVVRHSVTKKPLKAKFELIDLATGEVVVSSESDAKTGAFFVCIPSGREYALNVSKENYLFHSETFSITGIHSVDEPFKKNVYLKPFVEGEKIVLKNVFFETAKFDLKEKSNVELNKLVALLQENPSLKVEIGGHTDNVGNDQDNLKLSEERAKAVYDYVVSHGIDASRLTWKGYGESTPTDTNDTPEGRANNRRTELTIIGVGN